MNKTSIEWTDYTWNPVTGCTKISQGCKFCYAETLMKRFGKSWGQEKFTDVTMHPKRLNELLNKWKEKLRGKKVFVCDMSDLFHEQVHFAFIYSVFSRMALCKETTFQVLTKRVDRALKFYDWLNDQIDNLGYSAAIFPDSIPLPNVWIGTSCEDQKTADERIPLLLQIPAAVRFLSCEPLIGPIDICQSVRIFQQQNTNSFHTTYFGHLIHWVICGGESSRNARPMHPDWARSLRDQCKAASVPFFFKQWGEWLPLEFDAQPPFRRWACGGPVIDGHAIDLMDTETGNPGKYGGRRFMDAFQSITYCVEHDADQCDFLSQSNKEKFPPLLDGKQHLEFPKT